MAALQCGGVAAAAATALSSPSGQANWQRLSSASRGQSSSFMGLPIFTGAVTPRLSSGSRGQSSSVSASGGTTRSDLGKEGGQKAATKGRAKRKQTQKKQQQTSATTAVSEKETTEEEEPKPSGVAASSPMMEKVAISLDDVNPVGLGRKSRQMFDEVWRKFSGLGQISTTVVVEDSLLDPTLIRGPMCEFTVPEAQDTTVLVVGATSRIGRIVVRKLMIRGYKVKVTTF